MGLFDIPQRPGKQQAAKVAHKSNSRAKSATPTIRKGSGFMEQISTLQAVVEKSLGQYKDDYIIIRDKEVLHDYISESVKNGYIALDTETTGLDPYTDTIAGICPYTHGQKGAYLPLNHVSYITGARVADQLPADFVIKEFERLLKSKPEIDMFNANFDIRILRQFGLSDIYCTWDGYLASRLLNENEPQRGLKALHNKYCLDGKGDAFKFDDLFRGIPFTKVPISTGYLYAAHDPVITTELCEYQRRFLGRTPEEAREDLKGISWVFHNIEMPCVKVVCDMEDRGVAFDTEYAKTLSEKYHKQLQEKEQAFYDACDLYKGKIDAYRNSMVYNGDSDDPYFAYDKDAQKKVKGAVKLDDPINIASPSQLAVLFYDILKVGVVDKKSPRGTGEPILAKIDNPVAKAVLEYRTVNKLLTTYVDKLPSCVNSKDGRIHCSFNQYGADTGRFSSSDPNLQNIPSHNKDVRKMFVASPGYVMMSSDFSQQEPKCLAALCKQQGDSQMYNTFMEGKDLYAEIASKAFKQTYEECLEHFPKGTPIKERDGKWYYASENDCDKFADGNKDTYADGKERRTRAKSILLGVLYGRGENSIAEQLGCTRDEAKEIKASVFRGFPAIKQFEESSKISAEELGFVTTVCGRKRRLPDLQLDEFEFKKVGSDSEAPIKLQDKYWKKLRALDNMKCSWSEKLEHRDVIFREARKEGVEIINNGMKIADAQRQCVNSRIQGSAADLTKLAMINLNSNERLRELGFRLLIPIHDEVICECPKENMKECAELLAKTMSEAAEQILEMPIKCDVEITERWYGEEVTV